LNARVAALLIGPGAARLVEIEEDTRRRFLLEGKEDVHLDHFLVLGQGKLESLQTDAPVAEGVEVDVKLVEVGLHDPRAGVAKLDGYTVSVADAAKLVGKKVKARITRVLDGTAYAALAAGDAAAVAPITAESEAEKPTRAPRSRKPAPDRVAATPVEEAPEAEGEQPEPESAEPEPVVDKPKAAEPAGEKPKKRTRRGSRGGRGRKKKPAVVTDVAAEIEAPEVAGDGAGPKIHVPPADLGREAEPGQQAAEAMSVNGEEPPKPRKRTRRGTRGGRRRRRPASTKSGGAATAEKPVGGSVESAAGE
jgi:predicted RNA-binding protein with TRAM domain